MSNLTEIERKLWSAADHLRANSELRSQDYSIPVLGLIFLRYADQKFTKAVEELSNKRIPQKLDYQAVGVMYLPEQARYETLLHLPEGSDIGKAINDAMNAIEQENEDLRGILPKSYNRIQNSILVNLLKQFGSIPLDIEGDAFGKIYEYFLGKFAMSEGQKGGEFFTPTSIVKLIVEIIEPFKGRILDPACGSGGMFVQSAEFIARHNKSPLGLSVHGQERVDETVRLAKMNLAVHGLSGDIKQGNSYYDNLHQSLGKFDFVMANPPFNVKGVDKERLAKDPRYPLGMPSVDNGNYLWIELFYSSLNDHGRAGFVMANSASDARSSELEIRKKLIQEKAVDVIIAVGPNMFYTVTLPCTLWFLDKAKRGTAREDEVLFIDAREIYNQLDRAHREWLPWQIEYLSNIVRLYRGEKPEFMTGSESEYSTYFQNDAYQDVKGLCKSVSISEIEKQGWSLNPGRYVGVKDVEDDGVDFNERLAELHNEFKNLTSEAHELEAIIELNYQKLTPK